MPVALSNINVDACQALAVNDSASWRYKMKKLLALAVIILGITVSLTALDGSSIFMRPAYDPLPNSFGTHTRQELLSTLLNQTYLVNSQTWVNQWKITAEFNDLNQVTCNTVWALQGGDNDWVALDRMTNMQYRSDGRPLSSTIQQWTGSSWYTFGEINYHYENDLLMHVRYDCYIDGQSRPYWHLYYEYLPPFNILDKTVELWFNGNAMPFVRKHEYTWYCGNQPTEINEMVLDRFGEWGHIRHTFVYHDQDQTSHASYLRRLEFGWPIISDTVPGLQPVKLTEQRGFVESPSGLPERHRYFFDYNEANQMTNKRVYERDTNPPWSQTREYVNEYENGLQTLETYYDTYPGRIEYLPRTRRLYYYTESSSADEPATPELSFDLKVSPNPFKGSTRITYRLPEPGAVKLQIFNLKGQLVQEHQLNQKAAGEYHQDWDGKDAQGNRCAGGIYLYKIHFGRYSAGKKMILLR
jgi:hypothetical protein